MMRITTNSIYAASEMEISGQYQRIAELQQELSSGVSISSAEKNPVAMASINSLQSKLDHMIQSGKNAMGAKIELQTEQTQLTSYDTIIQKIRTIVSSAGNAGNSADEIKSNSKQIQQYLSQLVSIANTKNQDGNSIFAGTRKDVQAYAVERDDEGNITNVTYQGNEKQQKINLESGVSVDVYRSGDKTFGSGDDSVFHVLINLADRLKSGEQLTDQETHDALKKITDLQDMNKNNLTSVEDGYGIADFEIQMHNSLTSNYTKLLSNLRDADYTKTVSELSKHMTFLKATMSASVEVEKLSIFNQD